MPEHMHEEFGRPGGGWGGGPQFERRVGYPMFGGQNFGGLGFGGNGIGLGGALRSRLGSILGSGLGGGLGRLGLVDDLLRAGGFLGHRTVSCCRERSRP